MNNIVWERCANFHGHVCGGLTIGYKAALYATRLLDISIDEKSEGSCISEDEQLVCISENDACGLDAIQVILGCTIGKGNLLFHLTGKQAYSFYDRNSGKSVRMVLKPGPKGMTKEESFKYYQECTLEDMFDLKETSIILPEKARIFNSIICSSCKEKTAENMIRLQGNKKLCLDCYVPYTRFDI